MKHKSLPADILELRRRAHSGNFIAQHRAFRRVDDRARVGWSAVLLVLALTALVVLLLPELVEFWGALLHFAAPAVGLHGGIAVESRAVLPFVRVDVPHVAMQAAAPGTEALAGALTVSLMVLIASLVVPRRFLPAVYLLRIAVIIQLVSVGYFLLLGSQFPYTLPRYSSDMHTIGLAMIALLPLLYGLTYFVFDFGAARKILLVLAATGHLAIFVPLQYLLHAVVVHQFSLVYLPVLFMLFGALLDVAIIIALYGWAMSWRDRTERIVAGQSIRSLQ